MNTATIITTTDTRGVATISLNRPDKHNAFDDSMVLQLTRQLRQLAADDAVRVVVLTGRGDSFSAGADLQWMQRMASYNYEENLRDADALAGMLALLNSLPKPVIASVQGVAIGGGLGLVCCCDLVVAATTAKFCLSEVKVGLIPATISPYVLAAIGQRAARRYVLTAESFNAQQAQQLGLVSEVVELELLDDRVESFVQQLLANGPQALTAAKKLILDVAERPVDKRLMAETCQRIARIRISSEGQEGLSAFLQKRPPSWS